MILVLTYVDKLYIIILGMCFGRFRDLGALIFMFIISAQFRFAADWAYKNIIKHYFKLKLIGGVGCCFIMIFTEYVIAEGK